MPSSTELSKNTNEPIQDGFDADLKELIRRTCAGLPQIVGLGLLGLVLAASIYLSLSQTLPQATTTRVAFAFSGFEKGEYPDHSKFQPDDLRAPDIVQKALVAQGLNLTQDNQSKIRSAIEIEAIIPPNIVKERDRLRASGQTPPLFTPDEYSVTLTLPRNFPLTGHQRNLLLNGIVNEFLNNFQQTYTDLPKNFGTAFETLHNADYYEYELVLDQDFQNMTQYLQQQIVRAPTYRSPTTHLSFSDLLQQTELFSQIHLNGTLGLIFLNGLSLNRELAIMKMDYYLQTLSDEENGAKERESVVTQLLSQAQARNQNYVLGIKSQAAELRAQAPILDQGLIDSLLANDAYTFLVHRALEAGMRLKDIQAEKSRLLERRSNMETFVKNNVGNQEALISTVQKSLGSLEKAYSELTDNVRMTNADFVRQQYGNAIRISDEINTGGIFRPLVMSSALGAILGAAFGMGLSLIGFYFAPSRRTA